MLDELERLEKTVTGDLLEMYEEWAPRVPSTGKNALIRGETVS